MNNLNTGDEVYHIHFYDIIDSPRIEKNSFVNYDVGYYVLEDEVGIYYAEQDSVFRTEEEAKKALKEKLEQMKKRIDTIIQEL